MVCGGEYTRTTCVKFVDEMWIISHELQRPRYEHTSWTTPEGYVFLVGGNGETRSTELVKSDGTTEVGSLELRYQSR